MTLSKEERAALVEALENGEKLHGRFCRVSVAMSLAGKGLVFYPSVNAALTPAGRIVAELVRESKARESLIGKLMTECAKLRELVKP